MMAKISVSDALPAVVAKVNANRQASEFRDCLAALQPAWAVVLGSGLGVIADSAEMLTECPMSCFPELPLSKVAGHDGRFTVSRISGTPILFIQGRTHLYEGYSETEVTAYVRLIASFGIRRLILTNAAGVLNRNFCPGNWMMISDHLNLTGGSPLTGSADFLDMSGVYSHPLRTHFCAAAATIEMTLHEGIYAGVRGPQYETPAEVRMLASLGADAVGMSTVLEAIQARALGLEVIGFSCLTNWAAGLSAEPLRHEDVLRSGVQAAEKFSNLLQRVIDTSTEGAIHCGE